LNNAFVSKRPLPKLGSVRFGFKSCLNLNPKRFKGWAIYADVGHNYMTRTPNCRENSRLAYGLWRPRHGASAPRKTSGCGWAFSSHHRLRATEHSWTGRKPQHRRQADCV